MEEAIRADGNMRVIYKDWPIFGSLSERAARVAIASTEQGIYRAVHRQLMIDNRVINDGVLRDLVTGAGGDWMRLGSYLATHGKVITAAVRTNGEQALAIGLVGTPCYLAGPVLVVGAINETDFGRLFERARAAA